MTQATNVKERLAAITTIGTSIWLDQIQRSLVESGELARMVQEDSLRGLTSNPAIFEKAILGSPDYDAQIDELSRTGTTARDLYLAIATQDVQDACDVLRVVYDDTDHYDGFASFEVDPDLAQDTDKTLAQAREYWGRVDRPNLMIKIPGTEACLPAIEEALYEGININITLLFSVEAYRKVTDAYISAMQRRHAEGQSLDIHSVASFFVSRVDTEVDKRLEAVGNTELAGKAGIANAQAAYQLFKEVFHGPRFEPLLSAGVPVQRPLWASTGTKNPAYPDTLYVDGLLAPETVNTMPLATLEAAADHAHIDHEHPATADHDPTETLSALAEAGIDMDDVTDTLLREGITAFETPMNKLLEALETKRAEIAGA